MAVPTIPSSISLANIQTEFGGANPISISEYYSGAATGYVPSGKANSTGTVIPASGAISFANFSGAVSELGWQLVGLKGQDYFDETYFELADGDMYFYNNGTARWRDMDFAGDELVRWVSPPIFDSSSAVAGVGAVVELRLTKLSGDAPHYGNMPNGTWVRNDIARYFGWTYTQGSGSTAGGTFRLELRGYSNKILIDTADFQAGISY